MKGICAGLALVLALAVANVSSAAPIIYEGTLVSGVPVAGVNMQSATNDDNPIGANYFSFFSDGVTPITIFGDRQAGHFDMSFWVFSGLFADTNEFGGSFSFADPRFVAFGDDQDPPNIAGPFGDPRVVLGAIPAGAYTVAVTNFLSSAGPPNPFTLQADGVAADQSAVPEPASLLAWALMGSAAVATLRLRRRNRA